MTAHVVFEAVDPDKPATLSSKVIGEVIRDEIGFDGLLITDDLSMKALEGPMGEKARAATEAGCDLNLHCNGEKEEMIAVVDASPETCGATAARLESSLGALRPAEAFDPADGEAELKSVLGPLALKTG